MARVHKKQSDEKIAFDALNESLGKKLSRQCRAILERRLIVVTAQLDIIHQAANDVRSEVLQVHYNRGQACVGAMRAELPQDLKDGYGFR